MSCLTLRCSHSRTHTVRLLWNVLEMETIQRMEWPACSSDLNMIKHIWDRLGRCTAVRPMPPLTVGYCAFSKEENNFNNLFAYFLRQGKSPTEAKSYWPICLLPTVGKLLEKLIVSQLSHYLASNNFLRPRQFGLRKGRSCEKALHAIMTSCTDSTSQETTLH